MKEERLEILRMVAENKITVEEGERLLRALEKGEAEERETSSGKFGPRHRGPWAGGQWNWSEHFEKLGLKMQQFFDYAFGSVFGDEWWFEGYTPISLPLEDLPLDAETTLVLTNSRTAYRHGSPDVKLIPSEDRRLHLKVREKSACEVLQKEKNILVFCHEDTTVRVPSHLDKVKVILAKGDAEVTKLPLPLDIRTLKGNACVWQASHPLYIRTMKGKVHLELADSYAGQSEVSTIDGDIRVAIGSIFSGRIEAKAGKGHIRIQSEGFETSTFRNGFFRTQTVSLGSGPGESLLALKTMHGDITVTRREKGQ